MTPEEVAALAEIMRQESQADPAYLNNLADQQVADAVAAQSQPELVDGSGMVMGMSGPVPTNYTAVADPQPITDEQIAQNNAAGTAGDPPPPPPPGVGQQPAGGMPVDIGMLNGLERSTTTTNTTFSPEAMRVNKRIEKELQPAFEDAVKSKASAQLMQVDEKAALIDQHIKERKMVNDKAFGEAGELRSEMEAKFDEYEKRHNEYRTKVQEKLRALDDPASVIKNMNPFQKVMLVMGATLSRDGGKQIQGIIDRNVTKNKFALEQLDKLNQGDLDALNTITEGKRKLMTDVLEERAQKLIEAQEVLKMQIAHSPAAVQAEKAGIYADMTGKLMDTNAALSKLYANSKTVNRQTVTQKGAPAELLNKFIGGAKEKLPLRPDQEKALTKLGSEVEPILSKLETLRDDLVNNGKNVAWDQYLSTNSAMLKAQAEMAGVAAARFEGLVGNLTEQERAIATGQFLVGGTFQSLFANPRDYEKAFNSLIAKTSKAALAEARAITRSSAETMSRFEQRAASTQQYGTPSQ